MTGRRARVILVPVTMSNSSSAEQRELVNRIDFPHLSMDQLLELQTRADEALRRRFERNLTLVSLDLGNSAIQLVRASGADGSGLVERCRALIDKHVADASGRVYHVASARIDMCFPSVQDGLDAAYAMAESIIEHNYKAKREELIVPRFGMHTGMALTDGELVVDGAAEVVARIAEAAGGNLLWLSHAAMQQTSTLVRSSCHPLEHSGIISKGKRLPLFWMPLRAAEIVPEKVLIENTGEEFPLPKQDIISFGRLDKLPDGTPANEICLTLPDRSAQLMISRWHFELRRSPRGGFVVRVISGQDTEVDGQLIKRGAEAPVQAETRVCLVRKVNLVFKSSSPAASTRVAMTYQV